MASPRNAILLEKFMSAIKEHFPGIWQYAAAQQHIQINGALGRMADQQQSQYDATKIAKEAKAIMTLAGWIGEDNFPAVLKLMYTQNEVDLIVVCPSNKAMAAVPKSLKMVFLQSSIEKILGEREIKHIAVIVTPAMFAIFSSMKWHCAGPDFLTSGFFGNPFLWGACDEEATNNLNLQDQFIHRGGS